MHPSVTLDQDLVPPDSLLALADIASGLRSRVALPDTTLYRLVDVGLAGFAGPDRITMQSDMFDDNAMQ